MPRAVRFLASLAAIALVALAVVWIGHLIDGDTPQRRNHAPTIDEGSPQGGPGRAESRAPASIAPNVTAQSNRRRGPGGRPLSPLDRPPPTLAGTVRDTTGKPIAGATLELAVDLGFSNFAPRPGPVVAHTASDETGAYFLAGFPGNARFTLTVTHAEFARAVLPAIDPAEKPAMTRDVTMSAGLSLHGSVRASGSVVRGATVSVFDAGAVRSARMVPEGQAMTDADGNFTVTKLPAGMKLVRVLAAGLVPGGRDRVELAECAARPLTIDLVPGSPLNGRVVREGTTEGVARAVVELDAVPTGDDSDHGLGDQPTQFTESSSDGHFSFPALRDGMYRLVARTEDGVRSSFASARVVGAADAGAAQTSEPVISMPAASGLAGRVIDADTGRPVNGYSTWLALTPDPNEGATLERQFITDEAGRFQFPTVRPGSWFVCVATDGRPPVARGPFVVRGGDFQTGIEIAVPRGLLLVGRVIDDQGRPILGAEVTARIRDPRAQAVRRQSLRRADALRAVTDEDGMYALPVAPGNLRIDVIESDHLAVTTDEFGTGVIAEYQVPDVVMPRGGAVTGAVKNEAGAGDARATVHAVFDTQADDPPMAEAATDWEGKYALRGLRPGRWRVRLVRRDGQTVSDEVGRAARWTDVDVVAGTTFRLDF